MPSTSQLPQPTSTSYDKHDSDSDDLDNDDRSPPKRRKFVGHDDNVNDGNVINEDDEDPYTAPSRQSQPASSNAGGIGSRTTCIECQSKVIVTKYTPAGPDGIGVLCPKCTTAKNINPFKQPSKPPKSKKEKRKPASNKEPQPLKSLSDYAIQSIIYNIDYVESLGEIDINNVDKMCKILSKNRSLNSKTIHLFLNKNNDKLSLYDASALDSDCLKSISTFCPYLQTLTVNYCGQMFDEVFVEWSKQLKNLNSLHLYGPFNVKKDGWMKGIKTLNKTLNEFSLGHAPKFDNDCLVQLIKRCNQIRSLSLDNVNISDDGLESIIQLKELKSLSLIELSENLTNVSVTKILEKFNSSLNQLNISKNYEITNEIAETLKHCQNLNELILNDCQNFDNNGMISLFSDSTFNELSKLDLSNNIHISDEGLETCLKNVGIKLKYLNINQFKDLSNEMLLKLPQYCPHLEYLDISWCRKVDDYVIKSLLESCNYLKTVKVFGCLLLTKNVPIKPGLKMIGCPPLSI